MNMKKNIRKLPGQRKRVETGAVQFGDDWPGLFVRGDEILGLMLFLIHMHEEGHLSEMDPEYELINIINDHVLTRPTVTAADHEWARQALEEMGE